MPAAAAGEDVAAAAGASAAATAAGGQAEQQHAPLAAIKLPVRGLVALKLPSPPPAAPDSSSGSEADDQDASAALVQRVAAALLADIAAGKQARLAHVQRLIPVATTCCVEAAALQAAGARLAALVAAEAAKEQGGDAAQAPSDAAEGPSAESAAEGQQQQRLTFGIGLRLREDSGGAKPAAAPAAAAEGGEEAAAPAAAPAAVPMDRGAVIKALAAGFEGALREKHGVQAAVDLKSPDWVLLAEALPAGGQLYAALCVLPRRLCLVKPKLHIQPVGKAAGA